MVHADQLDSCPTSGMSLSQMEERLHALAQQRAALLTGMKDKLPDKYDPFKFDLQGERGLEPLDERRTIPEGTPVVRNKPEGEKENASQLSSSSPNVRRTRLSAVDDILKSGLDTLRGQIAKTEIANSITNSSPSLTKAKAGMPKSRTTSEVPQQGTAGVKANSQVPDLKIPPAKCSPRSGTIASSPRAKATSPVKAPSGAPQSPRTSRAGASPTQQKAAGRQISNSPSRSRAAMYGMGKENDASKVKPGGRQVSSSPGRNRSAAYGVGKETDVVRDRRYSKGPLWK
mmetsp:Transcript_8882/g.15289  ORF Transcript_8882/g.15289 Transcript_8882/m.15289 type:complete len:287 (+) Transcript_8882:3-863(+)